MGNEICLIKTFFQKLLCFINLFHVTLSLSFCICLYMYFILILDNFHLFLSLISLNIQAERVYG